MLTLTRSVETFPSVRLRSHSGKLPVEVSLIAQLGIGSGDQLIEGASTRQRGHSAFVDELDEPSARLGGMNLAKGDATSLYSFTVGAGGHPFHRHAGQRMFTAISGSAGAQLRFSTASAEQIARDPVEFVKALEHVNIPPDSLFTVRFGGDTWHQFVPLRAGTSHPALFALSCHANELGGELSHDARQRVIDNAADIPGLTEVLPASVIEVLGSAAFDPLRVPTVALSLDAPPMSAKGRLCALTRSLLGRARAALGRWGRPSGSITDDDRGRSIVERDGPAPDSLLRRHLAGTFGHQDSFLLTTHAGEFRSRSATAVMSALLEGFLENRPRGVSKLMAFRNALVKPLGLRTSPLGCPVSSLLSRQSDDWFADRFPVLAQRVDADDLRAQVILGADDWHLRFRSCVEVELRADGCAMITLGTRVHTLNAFGRFYMAAIDRVHRRYASPALLRFAVAYAVRSMNEADHPANAAAMKDVASILLLARA